MYTLDANIFARTIQANQPDYVTCETLITHLSQNGISIITPLIVLAEVSAAVRRATGDPMQARLFVDLVQSLPTIQLLPLDHTLAAEAAKIAADEALRGMDAIYVATAKRFSCTLITFDDDARRRAARIISVVTPGEALALL